MIKISDFSPHVAKSNTDHNSSCANCKVIINNNDGKALYPDPSNIEVQPQFVEREVNVDISNESLYKHLAVTFSEILKSNNAKLIANVLDSTGKVIISANDLVQAIALILEENVNNVKLSYEDPEPGCSCKSISPIKKINSIKINGLDFQTQYNKEYNVLMDEFNISLEKVIIFQ